MFKFDTLYFSCSPADLEFHINVTVGKGFFQFIPTLSFGQFFFQCFVYFMFCSVVWAQAFLLDMVFAIGKVQSVFCGSSSLLGQSNMLHAFIYGLCPLI